MNVLHKVAFIVLLLGGLNWLLLGLFNWEIGMLFGGQTAVVSKILYILVGLAAVYELVMHKGLCKDCAVMLGGKGTPGGVPPQA